MITNKEFLALVDSLDDGNEVTIRKNKFDGMICILIRSEDLKYAVEIERSILESSIDGGVANNIIKSMQQRIEERKKVG